MADTADAAGIGSAVALGLEVQVVSREVEMTVVVRVEVVVNVEAVGGMLVEDVREPRAAITMSYSWNWGFVPVVDWVVFWPAVRVKMVRVEKVRGKRCILVGGGVGVRGML